MKRPRAKRPRAPRGKGGMAIVRANIDEIILRYREGEGVEALGPAYGVWSEQIRLGLIEAGEPRRGGGKLKKDGGSTSWVAERCWGHRLDRCNRCGAGGRLILHHKDRDRGNNQLWNVETLCYSCHAIDHNPERLAGMARARAERILTDLAGHIPQEGVA